MSYAVVALLCIAVSFLAVRLIHIKHQLRSVSEQMEENEHEYICVDFVDKDIEDVVLRINKNVDLLQRTKVDAQRSEQSMKDAISMISHDMRTPLTSVIGYLQLAEKSCNNEETLRDIRIALDRAKYAGRLVDDFFELTVVESDRYTPQIEKLNICEIVCEEILSCYLQFEKKGIIPLFEQADDTIWVRADPKLLTRVIQNIISNGIKYSDGKIEFAITESDCVALAVSNSVSGEVDAERIFDKFYRADVSRKGEGVGLGLYICRKLVEDMNGRITACNENGKLTVLLKFPRVG